jgi:hypothetical protein
MPNSSTIPTVGETQATPTLYNNLVKDAIRLLSVAGSNKTIATGAITVDPDAGESHYQVDTEASAATDDLDTISGGASGDVIALVSANAARVITLRSGAGNIVLKDGLNIALDITEAFLLRSDGTNWKPYGGAGDSATSLTNKSGSTVNLGDVVVFDTDNDSAFETTTHQQDLRVMGVAKSSIANNAVGPVHTIAGKVVTVNCDTAAVVRGQFLISSATAGKATAGSYYREAGVFAIAITSKAGGSNGTVQAMLIDNFRQAIIGTSGWSWGNTSYGATAQKFTIATETWATVAGAALSTGRRGPCGMSYGTTAAYVLHGLTASGAANASNIRNKIPYATETTSILAASGAQRCVTLSVINFASKGFVAGGQNTAGTNQSLSHKITFATDAEAAAGSSLSSARIWQGGISDGTYCYVGGDTSTVTDRLDNATETYTNTATAALANAIAGYCMVSFPATAGYRAYNNGAGTVYSRKLVYSTATDASNGSSPSGNIASGASLTDGIAFGYMSGTAANNKLASSTDTYSSVTNYVSNIEGAWASYAAL